MDEDSKIRRVQQQGRATRFDRLPPWARLVSIIIPALVGSLLTWFEGRHTTTQKTEEVKDKAEAGYQITRQNLQEFNAWRAEIEKEMEALRAKNADLQRRATLKRTPPAAPKAPPTPPPTAPSVLPETLDGALQAVKAQAPPLAAPQAPPPKE